MKDLREIASGVLLGFHAKRLWGYDPDQHAEFEEVIAAQLVAERQRWLNLLVVPTRDPNGPLPDGFVCLFTANVYPSREEAEDEAINLMRSANL